MRTWCVRKRKLIGSLSANERLRMAEPKWRARVDYFWFMGPLHIAPTVKTPEIVFHSGEQRLVLSGRSIPENAVDFYRPVLDWAQSIPSAFKLTVQVQLEYFNTSSSKCLLDLFKRLEQSEALEVQWYFDADDEDMLEAGEDYDHIVNVPFKFVEIDPEA